RPPATSPVRAPPSSPPKRSAVPQSIPCSSAFALFHPVQYRMHHLMKPLGLSRQIPIAAHGLQARAGAVVGRRRPPGDASGSRVSAPPKDVPLLFGQHFLRPPDRLGLGRRRNVGGRAPLQFVRPENAPGEQMVSHVQ